MQARLHQLRVICWVLRVAVACEFLGHGLFALGGKESWLPFITMWGFNTSTAGYLLRAVGALDVLLAVVVLVRPSVPVLAWMTFWGLFTALLRPLTGGPLLDFIERGANWGAPLALLLLIRITRRWGEQEESGSPPSPSP